MEYHPCWEWVSWHHWHPAEHKQGSSEGEYTVGNGPWLWQGHAESSRREKENLTLSLTERVPKCWKRIKGLSPALKQSNVQNGSAPEPLSTQTEQVCIHAVQTQRFLCWHLQSCMTVKIQRSARFGFILSGESLRGSVSMSQFPTQPNSYPRGKIIWMCQCNSSATHKQFPACH